MKGLPSLNNNLDFYEDCTMNKLTHLKFLPGGNRAYNKLYIIYSDIYGLMNTEIIQRNRYFITFINDYFRKAYVYFIKTKDQAFDKFCEFKVQVENKTNQRIKIFCTDKKREFINDCFKSLLKQHGILYQVIAPHTP